VVRYEVASPADSGVLFAIFSSNRLA